MKCGIEWMLLDKDTDVIDVLIDNNEQHPTDMNITWNNFIKYYDPTSNSTESEDSTVETIAPLKNAEFSTTLKYFSTTIKVESPSPPETAGANVGVAVALGIGGFLLGCIIGTGSIIGYLYFMKNKSKSNVKTVVTSKSYTVSSFFLYLYQ
uniref:Uncharacterized protein n=1 Tax=Panagrolaimus superbus TaxID=310955 RepID=A0A914YFX4_9BILA